MLLLAFDTATPTITVAVHDGRSVVGEAEATGAMAHGEKLSPAIRDAMAAAGAGMADLTDVAVGVGPGPFTGLRVGVVTALTLGESLGLTTHGVCSLDVIAAGVPDDECLVVTDARRKEVYWARYAGGVRVTGPDVGSPAAVAELHADVLAHGPAVDLYPDLFDGAGARAPRAADLAQLVVDGTAIELPLEPLYLRRPDAVPSAGAKQA